MAECDFCGDRTAYPFHCRYCGGNFCAEHRLPSGHDCIGEAIWQNTPSPHAVDFSRLKDGRVGADAGPGQRGSSAPSRRAAAGPQPGRAIDIRWVLAAILVLVMVAILVLLLT